MTTQLISYRYKRKYRVTIPSSRNLNEEHAVGCLNFSRHIVTRSATKCTFDHVIKHPLLHATQLAGASGRGVSQTVHSSFALFGLSSMQVLHRQVPLGFVVGLIAAFDQSNVFWGGGFDGAGRLGASQIVHSSLALSGFCSMHMLHNQVPEVEAVGIFMPAEVQLNPLADGATSLNSKVGSDDIGIATAALRALTWLGPAG